VFVVALGPIQSGTLPLRILASPKEHDLATTAPRELAARNEAGTDEAPWWKAGADGRARRAGA